MNMNTTNKIIQLLSNLSNMISTVAICIAIWSGLSFGNNLLNRIDKIETDIKAIRNVYNQADEYIKNKANKDLDSLQSKVNKLKKIFR